MPASSTTAGNRVARAESGEIKAPKQPFEDRGLFPPSPPETLLANPPGRPLLRPRMGQFVCQHQETNAGKAIVSSWQYQL